MSDEQKPKWWRDPSWIAALSAVIIGASAFSVSLYQAYLMHEQQRMSVWPYLSFAHSDLNDHYTYSLSNEGVGPARIQSLIVKYNGEQVASWFDLLSKTYQGKNKTAIYSYLKGRVVPMNSTIDAFQLPLGDMSKAFRAAISDSRIELCYCSIYDDCYLYVKDNDVTTEKIAACPDPKQSAFHN